MTELSYNATIGSFEKIEISLEDIIKIIPYYSNHKDVWSDFLINIILDSGSFLDSLWRHQSKGLPDAKDNPSMKDYFKYYGKIMSKCWLVFWGEEPQIISPFNNWSKNGNFNSPDDINELNWWTAYTQLKHDRLSNRQMANLVNSVNIVGATLLAIIKFPKLRNKIDHAGWVTGNIHDPIAFLGEDPKSTKFKYIAVETKLFSYPVGWGCEKIVNGTNWLGNASARFIDWIRNYSLNVKE